MLNAGDVKFVRPITTTYGRVGNDAVPVYKIMFTVRGDGPYFVLVPQKDYTPQAGQDAIMAEAKRIADTMDLML